MSANRTPFSKMRGQLRDVPASELLVTAAEAALRAGAVPAEAVDSVNVGQVYAVGYGVIL